MYLSFNWLNNSLINKSEINNIELTNGNIRLYNNSTFMF